MTLNDQPANSRISQADLLDQLVEEFTARIRAGQTPSIKEYQDKHPTWKEEIHDLLSSVAMIEGLKKQSGSLVGSGRQAFDDLAELERLGEYRIVRELGRGGMGIVLEAVHESLGRQVAIKVLPNRLVGNEKNVERFTREARAAATLHHNNIVSVFGVGHSDGYYYYVMEHIDGNGLDQIMRSMKASTNRDPSATRIALTVIMDQTEGDNDEANDFQLNSPSAAIHREQLHDLPQGSERFRWAVGIAADIADALQYAHDQGVLHRDIKPGNLLLDPSGRVWLTDFGLVKSVANQTMTMAGDIIGTPQYMAPESFEARYDVASEIYCLGATLYEMVTLQPVCEQGSAAEMIRRITTSAPTSPRKIDPRIPSDLSTIIEKCLAREPEQRYLAAADLRDDLRAFLAGHPISARRASIPKRAWLWCKRNPWQTISAMLVGLVAILAVAGFIDRSRSLKTVYAQNEELKREKKKTQDARDIAEENARKFREQYERADANVGISLEMFDEMFKQMVIRGTGGQENFSFDGFQELSGIETTISGEDAEYLEKMLAFFQRFANENSENTLLIAESAKSFRRVANIYHLLGKQREAHSAYQKAIRLYERLNDAEPLLQNTIAQAQTANELGILTLNNGGYRQATAIFKRVKQQIETSPLADELAMQLELIRALNLMGTSSPLESTEALIRERDADNRETDDRTRRRGFRASRRVRQMGEQDVAFVNEAIASVNQLIRKHSDQPDVMPELLLERAKSRLRLAELQYILNKKDASLITKQLAVQDLSRLASDRPKSAEHQAALAQAYAMPIGQDNKSSLRDLREAEKITRVLCDEFPGNPSYLQLDAEVNYQLGQLNRELGNADEAITHYRTALTAMDEVASLASRNLRILARLNELTMELAEVLFEERRYSETRDLLMTNVKRATSHPGVEGRPGMPGRGRLARQYSLLAKCHQKLGNSAAAAIANRLAREARQRPGPHRPDQPAPKRRDKKHDPRKKDRRD